MGVRVLQLLRAGHREHGGSAALRHARAAGTWLKPLLLGEIRSCFAMTEPAVASSDATNIASSIVSDENNPREYVLNGRKWWTSGACDPRCALAIFMGKTAPDGAAPKHRSSPWCWWRCAAPGVRVLRPLTVFGYDDAPHGHAEVTFTDVRVNKQERAAGRGPRVRDRAGAPRAGAPCTTACGS